MKKKILSLILALSLFFSCCGINIIMFGAAETKALADDDTVKITSGTKTKQIQFYKKYMLDFGRAYPIDYITVNTSSSCKVIATNDEDYTLSPDDGEIINVALGKKIKSSRFGTGGYLTNVAANANDGDTDSAFISTPVNYTDEDALLIDLEQEYDIEYIKVNSDNKRPREVYVSNSEDFSEKIQISETSNGRYDLTTDGKYRYARIDFKAASNASNNHFYVFEVEVYAKTVPFYRAYMTAELVNAGSKKYELKDKEQGGYYRYIVAEGTGLSRIEAYTKAKYLDYENLVTTTNVSSSEGANVWSNLPLKNAGDNNENTVCAINVADPYIQVDLGEKKEIDHVEVILRRDLDDDRYDISIHASNDKDFGEYFVIGEQEPTENIPLKAEFVRGNKYPYEAFRYIRVYEGRSKTFLCLADIKVFARDFDEEYTDVLRGARYKAGDNKEIAYRIYDNDIKSAWYGEEITLDTAFCRNFSDIFISGEGEAYVSFYCETENTLSDYEVNLSKGITRKISCRGKGRYINIRAKSGQIKINEVKAYSLNDSFVRIEKETYQDDGWYIADLGEARLIYEIFPCGGVYQVSQTSDFTAVATAGNTPDGAVSGRYIRTKLSTDKIGISTYELPVIDFGSGKVTYDTSVYEKDAGQKNIISKYSADGKLIKTDISDHDNGIIETDVQDFNDSKFMVWDGIDTMKPLMPASGMKIINTKPWKEIYVETNGSDENDGTMSSPIKTIQKARDIVREISDDMKGDIIIHIGEGIYALSDTLDITQADSGKNGYKVIYSGAGYDKTSLSGGVEVTDFKENANGLWEAYLPDIKEVYQLTINGVAARIAHTETPVKASGFFMDDTNSRYEGMIFANDALPLLSNPQDAYMHTTKSWIDVFIRGEAIEEKGSSLYYKFYPIYMNFSLNSAKMSTLPITTDNEFEIENAYELLDNPGEFYFDKKTHKLYYMPKNGETVNNSYAEIPVLEDLLKISGGGVCDHAKNITFEGIRFENSYDPNRYRLGMITDQAQLVRAGLYEKDMVSGTISIDYAENITIQNCEIKNVEKTAISMGEGAIGCNISGNRIHDTGDGAVVIGRSWHNEIERHTPDSKQFDCAKRKPTWGSSGSIRALSTNQTLDIVSDNRYYSWQSESSDITRGEMPWYAIDLLKPYTISQIELYFPTSQRCFEVLVSNDEDFSDSKVLAANGYTYRSSMIIQANTDQKYRFIKIRKTQLERFAINGIYVRTPDEKYQYDVEELCTSNTIDNNYIERTGLKHKAAPAITMFYTANTKVTNNSIFDSNYTAISCGWGWEFNTSSTTNKNIFIAHNHIKNFNMSACDGGGVYIMGNQPGTVVEENYIEQIQYPSQDYANVGIYGESGLRYSVFRKNVIEIPFRNLAPTNYAITFFQENDQHCMAHDNYGTYIRIYDNSSNGSVLERLYGYDSNNRPEVIKTIINNSGCSFEH